MPEQLSESVSPSGDRVRPARSMADFEAVSDLQAQIWGSSVDAPPTLLKAMSSAGGIVLLAELEDLAVGFAYGFTGRSRDGALYHRSHAAAVTPEQRNSGLGRELKLAQRQESLDRGLKRMVWTFDPAQTKNAYFNLHRLGVVARDIWPDYYGQRVDAQNLSGNSDRLVAEWHLDPGDQARLAQLRRLPAVVSVRVPAILPPGDPAQDRLEVASATAELRRSLQECFAKGLIAVDFDAQQRSYSFAAPPTWMSPPLEVASP